MNEKKAKQLRKTLTTLFPNKTIETGYIVTKFKDFKTNFKLSDECIRYFYQKLKKANGTK